MKRSLCVYKTHIFITVKFIQFGCQLLMHLCKLISIIQRTWANHIIDTDIRTAVLNVNVLTDKYHLRVKNINQYLYQCTRLMNLMKDSLLKSTSCMQKIHICREEHNRGKITTKVAFIYNKFLKIAMYHKSDHIWNSGVSCGISVSHSSVNGHCSSEMLKMCRLVKSRWCSRWGAYCLRFQNQAVQEEKMS